MTTPVTESLLSDRIFPPGLPCEHAYPPGEFCPACGDVPVDQFDNVLDEHDEDCGCFACNDPEPWRL